MQDTFGKKNRNKGISGHADSKSSSQVNERCCFKKVRQRMLEEDSDHHSQALREYIHTHRHSQTYTTHTYTHTDTQIYTHRYTHKVLNDITSITFTFKYLIYI